MSPDLGVTGQKMRGKKETKKDKEVEMSRWKPIEREIQK